MPQILRDTPLDDRPRRTLASNVIARVLDCGAMDEESLARELIVTVPMLRRFRDQRQAIPMERQMVLALLILEKVPSLAKLGRQLRAQVRAHAAFSQNDVEIHTQSPPAHWGDSVR
jgi:hypothetical protein